MTDNTHKTTPPIVCDMTDAPDTAAERVAEYERLFTQALVGRDHTDAGIRFRFRADPGVEDWVRDLAAREKACCAWYHFDVAVHDDEIWWDCGAPDDPIAQKVLEDFYRLPDTIGAGPAAILEQFGAQGYVMMRDDGTLRPATPAELGLT
jgi:hypothetical protein